MKLILAFAVVLSTALAQKGPDPVVTGFTSNVDTNAGGAKRSFSGQPVTLTFTGTGLMAGDRFAFVAENDCSRAETAGALKAVVSTAGSSGSVVATWSGANVPTSTSAATAGLLRLCVSQGGADENGYNHPWRYYGTHRGLNYRIVTISSVSHKRFWMRDTSNAASFAGPELSFTGTNFMTGDLISYGIASSTVSTTFCSRASTTLGDATQSITANADMTKATFSTKLRFVGATSLLLYNQVHTIGFCWRPANAGSVSFFDTTQRGEMTAMTTKNAVTFVFPTILPVGGATFNDFPRFRVSGWNVNAADRFSVCVSTDCNNAVVSFPGANDAFAAPAADAAITYATTFTVEKGTFVWSTAYSNTAPASVPTAPAALTVLYFAEGGLANLVPAVVGGASTVPGTMARVANLVSWITVADCDTTTVRPSAMTNDYDYVGSGGVSFPRGRAVTIFVRGCIKNGDQFGYLSTLAACATGATVTGFTTFTDATWPIMTVTAPTGVANHALCRLRGTTFTSAASEDPIYGNDFVSGTATTVFPATLALGTNSQRWFMSGWKPGNADLRVSFAGQPAATTQLQFILVNLGTATLSNDICSPLQVATPTRLDGTYFSASTTSNARIYAEGNINAEGSASLGGAVETLSFPATRSVSVETAYAVCIRFAAAGATDRWSSWLTTGASVYHLPAVAAFPNTVAVLTASTSGAPVYITGSMAGDKVFFHSGAPAAAADFGCATAIVPVALTPTNGVASFTPIGSTSPAAFSTDGVAHKLCIIRGGAAADTRAIYMDPNAGGSTLTSSTSQGSVTVASAAYAGQAVAVTVSSMNFVAADNLKLSFTTSGTAACAGEVASSVLSYAATWTTAEDGTPLSSGSWTAPSVTIAAGATTQPSGALNNVCRSSGGGGVSNLKLRVVSLQNACAATSGVSYAPGAGTNGCAGTSPASNTAAYAKGFKVTGYGHYFPGGATVTTATQLSFDIVNPHIDDQIAFRPASATTFTAGNPAGPALSGSITPLPNAPAVSTSSLANFETSNSFFDTDTAVAPTAAAGGEYVAWYKADGSAWFNTNQAFLVVRITDRFPGSSIFTDGVASIYLNAKGFTKDAGDIYATSGTCTGSTVPVASATVTASFKPTVGTAFTSIMVTPPSGVTTFTASSLCYKPANQDAAAVFVNILPAAQAFNFVTNNAARVAPSVQANLLDGNNFYVFEGKATSLTLLGSATINDGYKPAIVLSTEGTCANAVGAGALGTTTTLLKDTTSWTGSSFTLTTPLLSAQASGSYSVCYTAQKTTPDAAAYDKIASLVVIVKPVAANVNVASGNPVYINTATNVQFIDIPVTTTNKINDKDSVCLVMKGGLAPASTNVNPRATQPISVTTGSGATAVTSKYYCFAGVTAGDKFTPTGTLEVGDYDVYVTPGAAILATTAVRSTPLLVTGNVKVVSPMVRMRNVVSGADARTLYVDDSSNGQSFIVASSCPAAGTTAGAVTPAGGSMKATFATAGAYKVCYQHTLDKTATKTWNTLNNDINAIATPTNANYFYSAPGETATFYKVHANTNMNLHFPWASHIAQATDVFRVLSYASLSRAAPATCATSVAADAERDVTMVGQYSTPGDDSSSVTSGATPLNLPSQASYYAASGQRELVGCWKQSTTSASTFTPFPTELKLRVVDVSSFVVRSRLADPLSNAIPRSVTSYYTETIWFNGRWLDADDFASFVRVSASDCSRAWYYESAITATAAPAVGDLYQAKGFSTNFERGINGGLYNLCYFAAGTSTGYRLYNGATDAKLRSVELEVSPNFATSGAATTFTLMAETNIGLAAPEVVLTTADRAAFTLANGDCSALVGTSGNLAQNISATNTFSATLSSATGATTYQPCVGFQMAALWNTYNGTGGILNVIDASGNIAATKRGNAATTFATGPSRYNVIVWAGAKLQGVRPVTVIQNWPTDVTFVGSGLSLTDVANVTTDATCNNNTVPTTSPFVASPMNQGGSALLIKGWTAATTGTWNICYKALNGAAEGTSVHGVSIRVVNVDSIAPTGNTGALTGAVVVTLTGTFNTAASIDGDKNWFGLIPRDITGQVRDCRGLNASTAQVFTTVTATSATITIPPTMASGSANEYSLCVHFAGMPWATPANAATDYYLINQMRVNFNIRGITGFTPATVVNNTLQTVNFMGAGIRDFDSFVPVAATSTDAAKDCAAAAGVAANVLTVRGRSVSGLWPSGQYRLCYGFNISNAIVWTFAGPNTITVESFQLKTLVSAKTADPGANYRAVVTGTGLNMMDTARLVNITGLTASGVSAATCEPTNTAVAGTGYYRVARDPANPTNWWFDVPPGDAPTGSYGICYRSGALPGNPTFIASTADFTIVFGQPAARLTGVFPTMIARPADSKVNFIFFGISLSSADGASIVAGTSTCAAPATTSTVTVAAALIGGRSVANVTLTVPGTTAGAYTVCYHYKNTGAGVASPVVVALAPGAQCPAATRFLCNGVCSATACTAVAANPCAAIPSTIRCPLTGVCVRTPADCAVFSDQLAARGVAPATCAGFKCFDGTCATDILSCPALDSPARGFIRCEDGSVSAGGLCTDARGVKIVNTCATAVPKLTFCANSGGCAATAEACPAFDGCPVGQSRCGDCTCKSQCPAPSTDAPLGFPVQCADGTFRATIAECNCSRHIKFAAQRASISSGVRRRFVVRASAALTITVPNAFTVDLPANVASDNNCNFAVAPAADSFIDAASTTAAYIASPTPIISIFSNGTAPCALFSNVMIGVTFTNVEPISSNATLICALPFGGSNAGSNVTVATAGGNKCNIMGSRIVNTAVALATGPITPRAPVSPSATPVVPSGTIAPSVTVAPSTTAAPSGGPAGSTSATAAPASPSAKMAFSSALVAVVLAALALLI